MKKHFKYITTAVAVLLIACFASIGVLRPQVSIFASSARVINGVIDNGGQLKAPETGSFSAIIPDNIVGRTNSAQGNYYSGSSGNSGASLELGVKLEKGFSSNFRLRERSLSNNLLYGPFQNGKSTVWLYTYAKQFFVFALREIII